VDPNNLPDSKKILDHLKQITNGHNELRDFLQKTTGLSVSARERLEFMVLIGPEVLRAIADLYNSVACSLTNPISEAASTADTNENC